IEDGRVVLADYSGSDGQGVYDRWIIDVGNRHIHRGCVSVPGSVGAVITDRVGEGVWTKVVRRWRVTHSTSREGDAAVRTLGDGDDRQTSVERWGQIIGIGVVSEHVHRVVAAVFAHRGSVIDRIRRVVDVSNGNVDRSGVGVACIASAIVTDGVGEAVAAEVVRRWRVTDSTCRKGDAAVRTLGDGDDR